MNIESNMSCRKLQLEIKLFSLKYINGDYVMSNLLYIDVTHRALYRALVEYGTKWLVTSMYNRLLIT